MGFTLIYSLTFVLLGGSLAILLWQVNTPSSSTLPSPPPTVVSVPSGLDLSVGNTHAAVSTVGLVSVYTYSTGQWEQYEYSNFRPSVSVSHNTVYIGIPELNTVF